MNKTIDIILAMIKTMEIVPFGLSKTMDAIFPMQKTFNLVISGLSAVDRFLLRIRQIQVIVVTSSERLKSEGTINGGIYNLVASSKILFNYLFSSSFTINTNFVMREELQINVPFTQTISLIFSNAEKYFSTTSLSSIIEMSFTPEIRDYYLLSEYDAQTLGDMDVLTLGELDYVSI